MNEDVGEVIVTVSMIGKTNIPITVDVVFSGTANEAEGNEIYTATFFASIYLLTLGAHARRGLYSSWFVCPSVCLSVCVSTLILAPY